MTRDVIQDALEAFALTFREGGETCNTLTSASEMLMYDKIEMDRKDKRIEALIQSNKRIERNMYRLINAVLDESGQTCAYVKDGGGI